jgi:hypothetical protein
MQDSQHRYAAYVEQALLALLLEIAVAPLSHFSEKSLQVRLSSKLLTNPELTTPVPRDVQNRYQRNLELIREEEALTGRDLTAFLDSVYRIPPLQMEYGHGQGRRIDIAILAPEHIRGICDPLQFQLEDNQHIKPIIGVEFGTEKIPWNNMYGHMSHDAYKLSDCQHGYSVNVMRNANVGRRSLKGARNKDKTIAVFKSALLEHSQRFPRIRWIGLVLHLAFGDVDCVAQSGDWVRCDISQNVSSLDTGLRAILALTCPGNGAADGG